jgi:multiple sugar transport system permease protein
LLGTMMIPAQVTMIPQFLIMQKLGWYNTLKPLWVMSFFGSAFSIFLLREFLKGIPRDLEDAARLDGCGFLRIYWHIMLPLVRPTLAVIAIFTFLATWNDFMGPLIYLSDQRLYPLSFGLYAFQIQSLQPGTSAGIGMLMAGSLLMMLPVIAIFFFAQRYFLQGITLTGMKG